MSEPAPPALPSRLGEGCWVFPLAAAAGPEAASRVLAARGRVLAAGVRALDVVPGLTSLGVHFDPAATDPEALRAAVEAALNEPADPPEAERAARREHTLPTRFDGPDLAPVAERAGLPAARAVGVFVAPAYTVGAVGFLPHFPYLLGLDPRLVTPRRGSPRTRVPAGSVAIGSDLAGVYPRESPGGWNLIGTTDPGLLKAVRPGDRVRFEAVR